MKIIFDEAATRYGTSEHPERPERLLSTVPHLQKVLPQLGWERPLIADDKALLLAHDEAHLARLRQPIDFDLDTPYYPEIDQHARRAAGGALLAVQSARQGEPRFFASATARASCQTSSSHGLLLLELNRGGSSSCP